MGTRHVSMAVVAVVVMCLALLGIYMAYRMGYINIGAMVYNNNGYSNSTVNSTGGTTSENFAVNISHVSSVAGKYFNGFVDAIKSFVSGIARNIVLGSRMDIVIQGFVYAVVFFLIGKLANMLAILIKIFMYSLSAFCVVVAVLALLGVV